MSGITRRNFVMSVAAGAAMAAAGPANARTISSRPLRIGIAGAGFSGSQHLATLASMRGAGVSVVAVADPSSTVRKEVAASYGIAVEKDGHALAYRDDVDAMIIATPEDSHAPLSLAALDAGKHVYCEPPMALSLADAERVAQVAQSQGCSYATGVTDIHSPKVARAKELIEQGAIGAVRGIHMRYPYAPAPGWREKWAQSGGVVSDMFYAKLLPAMHLLGERTPTNVAIAGGAYSERETWDAAVVHAEFPSGARIALATAPADLGEGACTIRGERGAMTFTADAVRIATEPGHEGTVNAGQFPAEAREHTPLSEWLAAIRGETTSNQHLPLAIAGQRLIERGLRADSHHA